MPQYNGPDPHAKGFALAPGQSIVDLYNKRVYVADEFTATQLDAEDGKFDRTYNGMKIVVKKPPPPEAPRVASQRGIAAAVVAVAMAVAIGFAASAWPDTRKAFKTAFALGRCAIAVFFWFVCGKMATSGCTAPPPIVQRPALSNGWVVPLLSDPSLPGTFFLKKIRFQWIMFLGD
jgi:hypothetical protein